MKPSEGPARVGIFEAATAVEKVTEMLGYGTGDVWLVWLPEHPKTVGEYPAPEHAVVAAVTGNGPTSEANARFIAECLTRQGEILKYLEALDEADRRLTEWGQSPEGKS